MSTLPDSLDYGRFDEIAEEFAERYRRGERPSLEEYVERLPAMADEIREMFPALVEVERAEIDARERGISPKSPHAPRLSRIGDYRILRELGRGGMGVVYEAEQVSLGRRVALKVLPGHVAADHKSLERFRREAKAAAKLHHTNIVPVFEVGQDGETAFYTMQFIQGQGLDQVIDELARIRDSDRRTEAGRPDGADAVGPPEPPLPRIAESLLSGRLSTKDCERSPGDPADGADAHAVAAPGMQSPALLPGGTGISNVDSSGPRSPFFRSVAMIGRQAAQGLAFAHARGVVHRDVKPPNLLLDSTGVVWITDFGLAKAQSEDDGLTGTGDIIGTLRYMAPERFRGGGDARADVYALGLTLYELLTLRPAHASSDRLTLIERIKSEEPVRPRSLDRRIPRDLETIVLKAIEKDPKARYQSAEAMGEDLRRFLADEPILARQVGATERSWRWARRNPGIAVLSGALAALLIATTIGSLFTASYFRTLAGRESRANQQSQEAERAALAAEQRAILERDNAQRERKAERWGRYRMNIAAAPTAMQLQNSASARRALDDAPEEHRGWEWQYYHNQLDGASLVLPAPGKKVSSLSLSPSGRQVAVACFDHQDVYLYDVATGKRDAVLRGHSAPGTSVAYRPDGKQVATIGNDQSLRLWDPATGRQTALLKPEVAPVKPDYNSALVYNSDGSRIATSSREEAAGPLESGTSRLWDTTTGKEIAVLAKWQMDPRPLVFSPDGKRVAVGSGEYVHLCDVVTGRRVAVLGPHAKAVFCIAYSPDGSRIASGDGLDSSSSDIHLWEGESGKEIAVLRGHNTTVTSLIFSPDGTRLASAGRYPDHKTRLWDAATGRPLAVLAGHQNEMWNIAFSPDGTRLATSSNDQTARLWDTRTGQSVAVLGGHTDLVTHSHFSQDGTRLVTASADSTLRLWNARTGEFIALLRGHRDGIMPYSKTVIVMPDGQHLISGAYDGTARIWDLKLAERSGVLRGHENFVNDVAFSPDGEQVASAAWDHTARLWDPDTGLQLAALKHEGEIVRAVVYSHDGRRLFTLDKGRGVRLWDTASRDPARDSRSFASSIDGIRPDGWLSLNPAETLLAMGSYEGPVKLWDMIMGREAARFAGHAGGTLGVAFHPEGKLLATTGFDQSVRLWDVASHAQVAVLRGHTNKVWFAAFNADGKLLASCSEDKTIRLWDVQTRAQLSVIPMGSIVYSVAFSPDGTRLAAACRDNMIRLFDVASRDQVAELRGHTDFVHAVAWSPDGTRLVSGSGDFTVRVWDSLSPAARASRGRPMLQGASPENQTNPPRATK